MRVTTVRLRPLRRKTLDEYAVETHDMDGPGFELWVGGSLQLVGWYPNPSETVVVSVAWATEWAHKHEQYVNQVLESAGYLVSDPPANGGDAP